MTNETTNEIDTGNYQLVGMRGDKVVVLSPTSVMTKGQALAHAAFLVLMAEDYEGTEFMRYLEAIRST